MKSLRGIPDWAAATRAFRWTDAGTITFRALVGFGSVAIGGSRLWGVVGVDASASVFMSFTLSQYRSRRCTWSGIPP